MWKRIPASRVSKLGTSVASRPEVRPTDDELRVLARAVAQAAEALLRRLAVP